MRNLDLFSMAEHDILSKIALFEVQEAAIMTEAGVGRVCELLPGVLQECELVEAVVLKVIAEINVNCTGRKSRQRDLVGEAVHNEIFHPRSRALGRRCVCFL